MRELAAETSVNAPNTFALASINTYIEEQQRGDGGAVLSLRFPLRRFFGGLVLEREVTVRVDYLPSAGGTRRLAVHWEPDQTPLFPRFDGTIDAVAVDRERCTLRIAGNYDVPLGVAGQLFDAVVGVRIAHGTLEGLLGEFKERIEVDYRTRRAL